MKKILSIIIYSCVFCILLCGTALAERKITITNASTNPVQVTLTHDLLDAPLDLGTMEVGGEIVLNITVESPWTITILDDEDNGREISDVSFAGSSKFSIRENNTFGRSH